MRAWCLQMLFRIRVFFGGELSASGCLTGLKSVEWFLRVLHGLSPRGSRYPNSRVLSHKIHTLDGFWTLKAYYLGTWTLNPKPLWYP